MGDTNPDRMIRLYFGQPDDPRPTKEEVGEFIVEEMGLTQGDDKPRWSEGVGRLIDQGMKAETDRLDAISHNDRERIQELESKVADYRAEVKRLQTQLNQRRETRGLIDAADRVHRIEASILEVLCRHEAAGGHSGPKGMNYVDLYEVARATGYEFDTVHHYAQMLSKPANGEHVQLDKYEEKAKATRRDAFEDYCDATGIDSNRIRRLNDHDD